MTIYIFQKIAQAYKDIKEGNLCIRRESHARRERESVPLLRVISPHPAPATMRSNEARKGKRNMRKENPRNVAELNLPLQIHADFIMYIRKVNSCGNYRTPWQDIQTIISVSSFKKKI